MLTATQPEPIDNIRYALTILFTYGLMVKGFASSGESWGKLRSELPLDTYLHMDGKPQREQLLLGIPVRLDE